jgi:hypothetical protein
VALAAGNPPPLLIAALQHDQHACKLRIQIAHVTTPACSLESSHLAFSSGAFAGPQPEPGSGHDGAPGGRYLPSQTQLTPHSAREGRTTISGSSRKMRQQRQHRQHRSRA